MNFLWNELLWNELLWNDIFVNWTFVKWCAPEKLFIVFICKVKNSECLNDTPFLQGNYGS